MSPPGGRTEDPQVWQPSDVQRSRDAWRRSRTRRSSLIAVVATVVFVTAVVIGAVSSPGWSRVQSSFLDPTIARSSLVPILQGLWLNIRVLAVCEVLILGLGLLIAALRTLRGPVFFPLRALGAIYTDVFRGMPLIVLLYLIGFGLPGLRLQGVPNDPAILGSIALVLCYTAYVAEVFRAGIASVHPSQRAAARSLGLSYRQTLRIVVLPQAVRRVLPALLNDFVALQKDVGLISVLGAIDAVKAAQIESARYFNFTPYVVVGLIFVAMAIPTARLADWAAARVDRRITQGGVV
ncbi:MAG: amino acid ABC transporter permease [Actinomycetes bacterium]